jgi:lycopene cyclase domain-containing protein
MTYFGVLAAFLLPPLVLFAVWVWFLRRGEGSQPPARLAFGPSIILATQVLLALVYTTPWDNYLVAQGVWWYDPALVTGVTLGWVPIEEYTFFVLQTLMTGLLTLALLRLPALNPANLAPNPQLRLRLTALATAAWAAALGLLFWGGSATTYLSLILAWAFMPILLQVGFGGDLLWGYGRPLMLAISLPTLYLWVVDAIAIQSGTWTISPTYTTGLGLGILPVEEMVFFLMTNTLVASGVVLMESQVSRLRLQKWLGRRLAGSESGLGGPSDATSKPGPAG